MNINTLLIAAGMFFLGFQLAQPPQRETAIQAPPIASHQLLPPGNLNPLEPASKNTTGEIHNQNANHQEHVDKQSAEDNPETILQSLLAEEIIARLNDPYFIETHTYAETLEGLEQLSSELRSEVKQELARLIQEGSIRITHFKPEQPKRYQTVAEGAPLPEPAEQLAYDQLLTQLEENIANDPDVLDTVSIAAKTLPTQLKQQLADKITTMIQSREIELGHYLGLRDEELPDIDNIKIFIE